MVEQGIGLDPFGRVGTHGYLPNIKTLFQLQAANSDLQLPFIFHNPHMKIALATDAWHPQISGVVTTLNQTVNRLHDMGHIVFTIHPGRFSTVACPTYPQIRLAINPRVKFSRLMNHIQPDAIHIATEGPIGLCCRQYCQKRSLRFTTSFTTRFDEYIEMRSFIPGRYVFRLLKWFHDASSRIMVASLPLKRELSLKGLSHTVLWPRGVDTRLFRISEKGFI